MSAVSSIAARAAAESVTRPPSRATATTCSAVAPWGPSSIVAASSTASAESTRSELGPEALAVAHDPDRPVVRGAQLAALRRLRGQHDVVAEMDPGRHVLHPP